jgi:hypothetical protein
MSIVINESKYRPHKHIASALAIICRLFAFFLLTNKRNIHRAAASTVTRHRDLPFAGYRLARCDILEGAHVGHFDGIRLPEGQHIQMSF